MVVHTHAGHMLMECIHLECSLLFFKIKKIQVEGKKMRKRFFFFVSSKADSYCNYNFISAKVRALQALQTNSRLILRCILRLKHISLCKL